MKKIVGYDYLVCLFAFFGLIGLSLCNIAECSKEYYITLLLPITYMLGFLIWGLGSNNTAVLVKKLIMVLMAIKMVLFPCLVILNGGLQNDRFGVNAYKFIPEAVVLQVLQFVVVCVCLTFLRWPQDVFNSQEMVDQILEQDARYSRRAWRVVLLCIVIMVAAMVAFPAFLYRYRPIFFLNQTSEILWKQNSDVALRSLPGIVYYPLNWLISESRLVLPYMLVVKVYSSKRIRTDEMKLLASLLVILVLLVLFVPDDVATSIYAALSLMLILLMLYPRKKKKLIALAAVMCGTILCCAFFIRPILSGNNVTIESIAWKLQVYFSGYLNTSAAVGMDSLHTEHGKIAYFLGDCFRSLPIIRGAFVDWPMSNELFNISLAYDTVYNSQIIPMEGQGYYYLWYPGAVLFTLFHMLLLRKFYTEMMKTGSTLNFYIYSIMTLLMTFGIVMYGSFLNIALILGHIPLLLISNLFVRRKKYEGVSLS